MDEYYKENAANYRTWIKKFMLKHGISASKMARYLQLTHPTFVKFMNNEGNSHVLTLMKIDQYIEIETMLEKSIDKNKKA